MPKAEREVLENHARLVERDAIYRCCGCDAGRGAAFILDRALPLPGKILEIGTGKGRFLTALLAHVPRVTTVDIDPAEQRCARLNVAYARPPGCVRFLVADAADLPWPDQSFDSVISVNALHHMRNIPRVIDEILRVVRPGGKIVLADYNRRGFDIMHKVHRRERRVHERIPYRLAQVGGRLAAGGWAAAVYCGECQNVLVAAPVPAVGAKISGRVRRIVVQ